MYNRLPLVKKVNSLASLYSSNILGQTRNQQNLNFLLNKPIFLQNKKSSAGKIMYIRIPSVQKSQFMGKFIQFAYIGPNTESAKSQFFAKQTKIFQKIRNDQQAKLYRIGSLWFKKNNSWASLYSSHILGQTWNQQNLNFLLKEPKFFIK